MTIKTRAELAALRDGISAAYDPDKTRVRMCLTGCRAYGAADVFDRFAAEIKTRRLQKTVDLVATGCHGFCSKAPSLAIDPQGIFYQQVSPDDVPEIIEKTILKGQIIEHLVYRDPGTGQSHPQRSSIPFFKAQERKVLRNCGQIDPRDINQYILRDGYAAIAKVLGRMTPDKVIAEIEASGLRGRGGAGFPTFLKWSLARKEKSQPKYLICNGDEGDPGAFMDRGVMEGDPHSVIEGMMIAAYAIGASDGYIYVRAEYPIAVEHLTIAIAQARELGLLGKNILELGFDFDLTVKEGAGAFVCGEETALIASIEGKRGTPQSRPPFPTTAGLWGQPTCINNVETLASATVIMLRGAQAYRDFGEGRSRGTKIFSLAGKVNNTGLVEVPMGIPMRHLIYDIGGGITGGKRLKAVQMGGPAGGCVPAQYIDLPITYESLTQVGAIMGSGGVIVLDENNCMVDIARYFVEFCAKESCGKCTPCRVGVKRMQEILTRMTKGESRPGDLELLEEAALVIKDASFCGLGQNAPNPVLSTLQYFRNEFTEHIEDFYCRSFVCKNLYVAPCVEICPVKTDARGYIMKIAEGRYDEALALAAANNPFPGICGRVCHHPCEGRCRRGDLDEPIAIRELKRFVADYALKHNKQRRADDVRQQAKQNGAVTPEKTKKIAVVGGGPAGLTAATRLAGWGYAVTVFDAGQKPGGAMITGIPAYRLPRDILEMEIDAIRDRGVMINSGVKIRSGPALQKIIRGYDAVLLATGAALNHRLNIPGENTLGVVYGLDFLRDVNLGVPTSVGSRVIIVGGGNVAIDAARAARRLGATQVAILYRRTRAEMPADREEIADAEAEDIRLDMLIAPTRIARVGDELMVTCVDMILGEHDASGRRRPVPVKGSEFTTAADTVIIAAGYGPDKNMLHSAAKNVFTAGDMINGATTVIQAVASGQAAAEAIDTYLWGEALEPPKRGTRETGLIPERRRFGEEEYAASTEPRNEPKHLSPTRRKNTFDEAEAVFTENQAVREAMRCLRCNTRPED